MTDVRLINIINTWPRDERTNRAGALGYAQRVALPEITLGEGGRGGQADGREKEKIERGESSERYVVPPRARGSDR